MNGAGSHSFSSSMGSRKRAEAALCIENPRREEMESRQVRKEKGVEEVAGARGWTEAEIM